MSKDKDKEMGEDESMNEEDSGEEEMNEEGRGEEGENEMDVEEGTSDGKKRQVYLPGRKLRKNEELVHDPSAYVMFHEAQTGAPCLSFDVVPDDYGQNREAFPLSAYFVAGTQSDRANNNKIILMKIKNLTRSKEESDSSSSEDEENDDSDDEEQKEAKKGPQMDTILLRHHGTVNRIRCKEVDNRLLCASWSDVGKVTLFDLKPYLTEVNTLAAKTSTKGGTDNIKPLHVFAGHLTEGYALDFCPTTPGVLATGDCRRNIHLWKPMESGWHVDQRPLVGHKQSVEDIQWSPNEPNVMATCSVDKSIRIWDTREGGNKACKLTVEDAHKADVNVISWNRLEPLIVSGGDDGIIHVWDLRQFKTDNSVATFKHHARSVTTVEWCPSESSVFASGGEDDQVAIWDLAAERDLDQNGEDEDDLKDLPQELLFIHQGQTDIKELHWHPQITGMITSTANSGFNFFRTISL